jgi:hypothetical protein
VSKLAPKQRRQSQLSDIAKAVLVSRQGANLMSTHPVPSPAVENVIANIKEIQLEKEKTLSAKDDRLAPPKSSLGRALQQAAAMGSESHGTAMTDTPLPSGPSTAPGSPRL